MASTNELFPHPATLIGMLHLGALPGTPFQGESLDAVVERAVGEARLLAQLGYEVLIVENMGDRPYLAREVGPEITAAMTRACLEVRRALPEMPLGVQVLAGVNETSIAVAHATGADFIRAEGFVFASVADEGILSEASAGPLLRYRRQLGAEHIAILADVKKKHSSHAITSDVSLAETARACAFSGADALIVTGVATGEPTRPTDLALCHGAVDLPILVGSGVTPEQVPELARAGAAGLIVGSYLKREGDWRNPVDPERAAALVTAVKSER